MLLRHLVNRWSMPALFFLTRIAMGLQFQSLPPVAAPTLAVSDNSDLEGAPPLRPRREQKAPEPPDHFKPLLTEAPMLESGVVNGNKLDLSGVAHSIGIKRLF